MSEKQDNIVSFSSRYKEDQSDAVLLSSYISGDARSFDVFYDKHKKKLFNYALKYTDYKQADAEDVVMDVFLKFTKKVLDFGEEYISDKFGDDGSAQAYLFTAIKNQAIGSYRKAYKQKEVSFEVNTDNSDEQNFQIEVIDTMSVEEASAIELHNAVLDSLWLPVREIENSLSNAQYPIDKKRLATDLEKAIKQAENLFHIYELLMSGLSLEKIATVVGIDRKTLQKRRKIIIDLLQPLLPDIS